MLVSDAGPFALYVRVCRESKGWLDFYRLDCPSGALSVLSGRRWDGSSYGTLVSMMGTQTVRQASLMDLVTVLSQFRHWEAAQQAIWSHCPPEWRDQLRTLQATAQPENDCWLDQNHTIQQG